MAKTLSELRTLVLEPVDMQEEDFVDEAEVNRYINQGIRQAESEIHTIYQDYFLNRISLPLEEGVSSYDLPEDIYAHKIRKIMYDDGSKNYIVKRIRDLEDIPNIEDNDAYLSYLIINDVEEGAKIQFYPTPNADSDDALTVWYLRDAKELESDSDELDIPEFYNFVVLYARHECLKKELGNPILIYTKEEMERERRLMVETLTNRYVDNDTHLLMDDSFYTDYENNWWGVE